MTMSPGEYVTELNQASFTRSPIHQPVIHPFTSREPPHPLVHLSTPPLPAAAAEAADPTPHRKEPADGQTQWYRGHLQQLHNDAGLLSTRLPVSGLQRSVIVPVQQEQGLTE